MQVVLDVKGLNCPLPVLRVKKKVKELAIDDTMQILATDPGAARDVEAFCTASGNEFLGAREESGVFVIEIRRRT